MLMHNGDMHHSNKVLARARNALSHKLFRTRFMRLVNEPVAQPAAQPARLNRLPDKDLVWFLIDTVARMDLGAFWV